MATSYRVTVSGPNSIRQYRSIRRAARALSGNGTDSTERTRSRIRRRLDSGGGYIGNSYIDYAHTY